MTAPAHTTLFSAIQAYDIDSARKLLEDGADPNEKNDLGNPVIMYAVSRSRELVELLLDNGADIDIKNEMGTTPIMTSIILGRQSPAMNNIMHYLIEKGASLTEMDIAGRTPLDWAISVGNEQAEVAIGKAFRRKAKEAELKIKAEQKRLSDIQETIAARQDLLNRPHTKVKIIRRATP